VLLPNQRGEITEGSLSNLFAVDATGRLLTPGCESGILRGITRKWVMELARGMGMEVIERSLYPEDLFDAEELFLTASTLEVLPVSRIEDRRVGKGGAGPRSRALLDAYRRGVRDYCRRFSWPEA